MSTKLSSSSLASNRFGLHDVLGNVWEWCKDEIEEDKRDFTIRSEDPLFRTETKRVMRGGSWRSAAGILTNRVTAYDPQCGPDIGFRPILIES